MALRSDGEAAGVPTRVVDPASPRIDPASPRTDAPSRGAGTDLRTTFVGLDHGTIMSTELLSAVLTWTAIGWLVDRWLGTAPWFIATGAMLGNAAGLYLVYLRSGRMEGFAPTTGRADAVASPPAPAVVPDDR